MKFRTVAGRSKAALALTGVGGALLVTGMAGLGPTPANSSSHREAPLIAGLPQYDTTDLYAFRSPDRRNTVTLIANWIPFEEPAGGPNFYSFATDARYNIKIDNDGDARPDVTFRWTFEDHYVSEDTFLYATGPVTSLRDVNLNYYQTYRLEKVADGRTTVLVKQRRVVPSDVGEASMPNYGALRSAGVTKAGPDGSYRTFAGQAEDPFFLDLRVFDLLYGGDFSESGDDTLAGFNVNSVALQVPRSELALQGRTAANPIVGIWSTTDRRGVDGSYRQVSRLGMPLVNEVVIPLKDKNRFNASAPRNDGQFLDYVTEPELPKLIEAVYGVPAPAEPRNDLVSVFLTGVDGLNKPAGVTPSEQLRLNMTTPVSDDPDSLGVIGGDNQGFPNGRRLADDVIDIALQVVEGELVGQPNDLADGVDANDVEFRDTFPYLALPASGSDASPHPATAPAPKDQQDGVEEFFNNGVLPLILTGAGGGGLLAGAVLLVRAHRRQPRLQPATA
ncbi:DUF4331 domain-containing protein [Nocardioides bizhenqiangii]|uniref:DUF4331 domain-containing protein n=1 Tax=Nocardioides bizhenqiangii TaxID=3095076 RepID=A0ABZ0ZU67_9ACTN|nr:DUF4331 domain-containing protein [Nocardioides sp. HM61]WQQ27835.1 DUF4331 domain-containing protein [Nocardioides sp. HM61]